MDYHFSGGLVLSTLVLVVVVALPMKLAAQFADAKRTGIIWCGLAAFVGLIAGFVASAIFGGTIGGPLAAALGFALAIRFMLGTTFFRALGLMLIAMFLSFVGLALLAKLGVITGGSVVGGTAV